MSDAILALIGVLVGTFATVGFQLAEKTWSARTASKAAESTAVVALLDAYWLRLSIVASEDANADADRLEAYSKWTAARTRFIDSEVDDPLIITTWLDLTLVAIEEAGFITWHDASSAHRLAAELISKWREADEEAIEQVKKERELLKEQYWSDEDEDEAVVTSDPAKD